jgi:hypothetical protein
MKMSETGDGRVEPHRSLEKRTSMVDDLAAETGMTQLAEASPVKERNKLKEGCRVWCDEVYRHRG